MPLGIPESTAAFQPKQNTWCSLGLEAMTGPFSPSVTRPALYRYAQDAWLPRLTPARVRCSLPADAVVVRSRAAAAAALATLAQRAPLAF